MILLPAIDLYEGKVVRLTRGDYIRMTVYREDPLDQAREFEIAGAAWLHTVDLEGARDGTTPNFRVVAELCRSTGLQVEVGGGIRTLEAVARSLPALWRAEKVQKKAKKAGFDWPDVSGALDKLSEELEELKTAVAEGTNVEEELGDLLFSAVNVSRFVKVDTEEALNGATDKFIGRFRKVEEEAARQGRALEGMSLAELDKLWEHAKET